MSLWIDVDNVTDVLIDGHWHEVDQNTSGDEPVSTFTLDAYEYHHGNTTLHGGGWSDVCATGFGFASGRQWLYGPLTAISAVKCRRTRPRKTD